MHSHDSTHSQHQDPEAPNVPGGKRSVFAVILGNAVEFFDFGVYATFAVMIGHTFFPSDSAFVSLMLSVTAFGVGFIVRPLGAVLIGAYADRVGRKPAMLLTLVMMAVGTGSIAILPSYESIGIAAPILLVLTRLIQGLAWGGEAGPATTYILEAAPAHKRGWRPCAPNTLAPPMCAGPCWPAANLPRWTTASPAAPPGGSGSSRCASIGRKAARPARHAPSPATRC